MAERSRPDPRMVACKWSDLLRGQGLNFAAVIDQRIQAYNKGRTEAVAISQPEKALIKLYVHQSPGIHPASGVPVAKFQNLLDPQSL